MSTIKLRLDYLLNFPFGFTIDNVRCGSFVVGAVSFHFMVADKEIHMKYRVNLHGWG